MTSTQQSQSQHTARRLTLRVLLLLAAVPAIAGYQQLQTNDPAETEQVVASTTSSTSQATGCWIEWKADGTAEQLYGDPALAPADSRPIDCQAFATPATSPEEAATPQEDDPAFDCRTMGNQVCGAGAEVADVVVPAGDYSDGDQVAAPVGACLAELGYSAGPVVRADAERCAKEGQGTNGSGSSVRAEDGTLVPASFYDRTDYNRDGVVDQESRTQPVTVRAEDGTSVPSSFYSATDYNRDGLVDQTGKRIGD